MKIGTIVSLFISAALVGASLYFASDVFVARDDIIAQSQNVEVRDGIQYVTVVAQGGYYPRTSVIQPNLPTKLIVKTNGTYDCSAALAVRSAGFEKILQPTGEEVIGLGALKPGDSVQGVCWMGMYGFQIRAMN
jgi:hypothetical protein